jgi:predicted RNA-binding protein YlqC (UPF0109 family)
MKADKAQQLARLIFGGLIAYPEDLEVFVDFNGGNLTEMSIRVNAADRPRVLGKHGKHFKAVKEILALAGARAGRQVILTEMREPVKGQQEAFPPFKHDPDWPKAAVLNILRTTGEAIFREAFDIEETERDGRCRVVLKLSDAEPGEAVRAATQCLPAVFPSIGMTQGCILSLDLQWGGVQ